MGRGKDERISIWTDLLIILVLVKFVMQRLSPSLFVPLILVVFVFFLALRSRCVHSVMRHGLSLAAVGAFLIDIFYTQGQGVFFRVLGVLILLFLLYLIMRRYLGFLGFR